MQQSIRKRMADLEVLECEKRIIISNILNKVNFYSSAIDDIDKVCADNNISEQDARILIKERTTMNQKLLNSEKSLSKARAEYDEIRSTIDMYKKYLYMEEDVYV